MLRVNDGSLEPLPAQKMSVGGGGCDSKETPHHQAHIARVTTSHLMLDDSTGKIDSSQTQDRKVIKIKIMNTIITSRISRHSSLNSAANSDGVHSGSKSAGSTYTA